MKKHLILLAALVLSVSYTKAQLMQPNFGVTLCGAEFGENNLPGILNTHYTYPVASEVNYFASKGAEIIQLPFRWERVQRTLGGPLDEKEIALIKKFVDDCAKRNVMVTLVMQNFARYKINNVEYIIGSPQVSLAHYRNVWKKLACTFKEYKNIFAFSIMSEPNHMENYSWFDAAQQAIMGIREVDRAHTILVDGDNYSGPETWVEYNDRLKYLVDSAENMMFNAHCYFDEDRSGHYVNTYDNSGANEMTGVERIAPFIQWAQKNHKRAFVGEFGIPKNDSRWLTVLENFLRYLIKNNTGGCYWAAGPWWKNYSLSIEPKNNNDQPQMMVYAKYLDKDIRGAVAKSGSSSSSGWYNSYARNDLKEKAME